MRWSEEAMSESFFMSNLAPQIGPGFNRGIWKALERRMRYWACDRAEPVNDIETAADGIY